jgi:hypothetical protein
MAGPRMCMFLMYLQTLAGATYYIAPEGDDGNPGTIQRPWASVPRAVRSARPGDVIILRDGVYGALGLTSGFPVWITRPGTPDDWIVLKAEHKWGAILDCESAGRAVSGCDGYIYLDSGAAYWVIQDLIIRNGRNFGISSNSTPAAHDILIRGCRFESIGRRPNDSIFGEAGVYAGRGAYNFTLDGNVFRHIGRTSGPYWFNDHGLYLHSASTTIVNNIFHAPISGWGLQTASGFSGLIAHNTFALPMRNTGGHIMLWGSNSSLVIRNNIFFNPAGGIAINTSSLSINGGCSVDHNVVTGAGMGWLPGCAVNSNVQGDAGLVNGGRSPYDFHLRPGSAAINAGPPIPSITTDFDGQSRGAWAADAGAYVYSTAAGENAPALDYHPALPARGQRFRFRE